ncbi:MAG: ABC transporter permease [Bacilli bacterium]|nr:ABC transporter permease [Bacilli bacterium]
MKTTTKIAKANLRENKSKSLLICISIMLTTMLLTIIALFAYGVIKEKKVNAGAFYGEYFGGYAGVDKEIFEKVKIHGEFYDVGRLENFATVSLEGAEGILSFMDETARQLGKVSTCEGTFPAKENEIAGQKGFFQGAGLKNPKIGDKVCVKYRVHHKAFTTKEFVICGFLNESEKNDLNKRYGAYVSEDFYGTEVPEKEQNYSVVFKVKNEENLDIAGMQEKIENLAVNLGVEKKQVIINRNYLFGILEPELETIGICCVIAVLVILFSVLVIYNIFYVGIIQKIQEYGKFRAIGTTKKQIKINFEK